MFFRNSCAHFNQIAKQHIRLFNLIFFLLFFACSQDSGKDKTTQAYAIKEDQSISTNALNKDSLIKIDSAETHLQDTPKQTAKSLTKKGKIQLKKGENSAIWYYPNEFVGTCVKIESHKDTVTINGRKLVRFVKAFLEKEGEVAAALNPWLCTYYVQSDSVDSWRGLGIIQGQAIHVNGIGGALLMDHITIHFNRKPTATEFDDLVKGYNLIGISSNKLKIASGDEGFYSSAKLTVLSAREILQQSKEIEKKPFVDWVQQHVHSGEPVRMD